MFSPVPAHRRHRLGYCFPSAQGTQLEEKKLAAAVGHRDTDTSVRSRATPAESAPWAARGPCSGASSPGQRDREPRVRLGPALEPPARPPVRSRVLCAGWSGDPCPSPPGPGRLTLLKGLGWPCPVQVGTECAHGDVPPRGPVQAGVTGLHAAQLAQLKAAALPRYGHGVVLGLGVCRGQGEPTALSLAPREQSSPWWEGDPCAAVSSRAQLPRCPGARCPPPGVSLWPKAPRDSLPSSAVSSETTPVNSSTLTPQSPGPGPRPPQPRVPGGLACFGSVDLRCHGPQFIGLQACLQHQPAVEGHGVRLLRLKAKRQADFRRERA